MQIIHGNGLALTEEEVDAILADDGITNKTDLVRLRLASAKADQGRVQPTSRLYIAWLPQFKWQLLQGGQFLDVLHGDTLAAVKPVTVTLRRVRVYGIQSEGA